MFVQSSVTINQISLDESGEHVGICSEDGKVRFVLLVLDADSWVLLLQIRVFHLS